MKSPYQSLPQDTSSVPDDDYAQTPKTRLWGAWVASLHRYVLLLLLLSNFATATYFILKIREGSVPEGFGALPIP